MERRLARPRPAEGEQRPEDHAVPRSLALSVAIVWRVGVLVIATAVVVVALARVWLVVLPVVVALMITAVLSPPVRWLERHRFRPLAATWTVFLFVAALIVAFWAIFGPRLVDEVVQLPDAVDEALVEGRSWLIDGPIGLSEEDIDRWVDDLRQAVADNRQSIISGLLSQAVVMLHLVVAAVMTVVLSFFFVKDGPRMAQWLLDWFSGRNRVTAEEVGRRLWSTLAGYIRGSAFDGLIEAILTAIGLLVLRVPLVIPLAMLTFFGGFIPFVGALLAGTVATFVALATQGPLTALLVALMFVGIQNIEGQLLEPLVMGRVVKLHPVVVLISVTTGGLLYGIAGAFLAVPVVASVANVGGYLLRERQRGP